MRKKVKAKWGINLFGDVVFLVKSGDIVGDNQVLAKIKDKKVNSFDFSDIFRKLGLKNVLDLNEKFANSLVSQGDVFCKTGGMFSTNVCFPLSGKFLEFDDHGFLKIEEVLEQEREIVSPVGSKVSKIEDDKISLEFSVYEFKGEGLVGGKTWGKGLVKLINESKDLDFSLNGSLLFTNNLSKSFLLKAEVTGVVGIVTNSKKEDIETDLPVLFLGESEWVGLMENENKLRNFLLNSRVGRLLMVLE